MGTDKLKLPLADRTLGSIALKTALESKLDRVIVVTKEHGYDWLPDSLLHHGKCLHVTCSEASLGQSYSLRCGLKTAQAFQAEAVVIFLADQPFVSKEILNELIVYYEKSFEAETEVSYVASSFQGISRPPVLFSHELFPHLLALEGDEGARKILRKNPSFRGISIEYSDPKPFLDVDTREDYYL